MAQVPNSSQALAPAVAASAFSCRSVRIRGTDAQGKAVDEETETLAINAHGALVFLTARFTSGSKVQLQHKRTLEDQECHVVFLGPVRAGKAEIGLEFSTPNSNYWRVAFPPEDWTPSTPKPAPSPAPAKKAPPRLTRSSHCPPPLDNGILDVCPQPQPNPDNEPANKTMNLSS